MTRMIVKGACWILMLLVLATVFSSCRNSSIPNSKIHVLATTTIVADIVQHVGSDLVDVKILIPLGADPHEFYPRPRDAAMIADADIIFLAGAGLEAFMPALMEGIGVERTAIDISVGIDYLYLADQGGKIEETDPHTWMDPNNIKIWLRNITTVLERFAPEYSDIFRANADNYQREIDDLDRWIRNEVDKIPLSQRNMISDHDVFGYFIEEYNFPQNATIIESFSSGAAPSATHLAFIEELIINNKIPVIFVTEASSEAIADQIAEDTDVQVVHLLHGSLTGLDGVAPSYLDFMRYNVTAIVEALK